MISSRSVALAAFAVVVAGCGTSAAATPAPTCTETVNAELTRIARNIVGQEVHGRDVVGAVRRVEGSPALAAAVERDDPVAARKALRPLLRADIRHIEIFHGTQLLTSYGRGGPALGPVRGTLPGGSFTLATGTDGGIAGLISELTGARVSTGALPARAGYTRTAIAAEAYPSGPLKIELRFPPANAALCGASTHATIANTVGAVGQRLYAAETSGARTRSVLKKVATDPRFIRAVERRDPVALRAQIVRFFQDPHLHVVRIRANDAHGHLINDVGGPYVLAPASATVKAHGRRVGKVTLSIQDDGGYIKLMHRFTGAVVILRTNQGVVPGSNHPVAGRSYEDSTFTVKAFPAGPLQISLLTDPPAT